MEGKEFIGVAQKLVQMRSEAAIRSAISRAYYATFITGRELLLELGFSLPKDASAHEQLYFRLQLEGYYQPPLRNQLRDGIQEYERKIGFNS